MGFQLRRIGQLFLDFASGVVRPVQVISRSFSHAGTCMYYSPLVPSSKLSRQLFLCTPTYNAGAINSSVNYTRVRVWPRDTNTLLPKYLYSQASRYGPVTNIFNAAANHSSVNCKVTVRYSKILLKRIYFQFHDRLMSDSLPAIRSDDKDASHNQIRNAPMDIEELVQFLRDENASDVCVIRVPPHLDYVDYFVVCSGFGGRHLRRMAGGLATEVWHLNISHTQPVTTASAYLGFPISLGYVAYFVAQRHGYVHSSCFKCNG